MTNLSLYHAGKGKGKGLQGTDSTTAILLVGILILGVLAAALLLSKRS